MIAKLFSFFLELDLDLTEAEDDFHDAFKLSYIAKVFIWIGVAIALVAVVTVVTITVIRKTKKSKKNKRQKMNSPKTGK